MVFFRNNRFYFIRRGLTAPPDAKREGGEKRERRIRG